MQHSVCFFESKLHLCYHELNVLTSGWKLVFLVIEIIAFYSFREASIAKA